MSEPSIICIAGKNDIATRCLEWLLESGWPSANIVTLCNRDDAGRHTWQYSLRFSSRRYDVREVTLEEAECLADCLFLSLEFDRIIKPKRFVSDRLFNIHFSRLPEYRGVHTAIWPIIDGRSEVGVTLHRIDPGIDTGEIIDQKTFPLPLEWTSRDLYQGFLDYGAELVISRLPDLIAGSPRSVPQSPIGASYHGRSEIDFNNLPVRSRGTAYQIHNNLRAFSFWEYQLPVLSQRQVLSSSISSELSSQRSGQISFESDWTATIATLDYDVRVLFNVYQPVFEWARQGGVSPDPECLKKITDWDRTDQNGWNALMIAAWSGHSDAVEQLLEFGADQSFANRRGTTPLMYAASCAERTGNDGPLKVLLAGGARVDALDAQGLTVLDHLRQRGSRQLASLIEAK